MCGPTRARPNKQIVTKYIIYERLKLFKLNFKSDMTPRRDFRVYYLLRFVGHRESRHTRSLSPSRLMIIVK